MQIVGAYGVLSILASILATPYHQIGGLIMLVAGPMGGLRIFFGGISRFSYEDLSGTTHYNPTEIVGSITALGIWIFCGFLLFVAAKQKWRMTFSLALIALWIGASACNTWIFALRGL